MQVLSNLLPHSFIFTTHISFISTANVHYAKFDIGKLMVFMSLFDEDRNVVSGLFVLQNNPRPEKGYCERPSPQVLGRLRKKGLGM